MSNFSFNWLHITDIHVGMKDQSWLWPNFKHQLFEDLKRIFERVPSIDCVIFSGDFVQKGDREEFDKLDEILEEIWEKFLELGANPSLFHIPGNHDLARPNVREPTFRALSTWWETPELREEFFRGEFGYKDAIQKIFENYTLWSSSIENSGKIPILSSINGILPGDKSSVFHKGNAKIGLIGLNSTWLQFSTGDMLGKLHVDPRQILAVTNDDPQKWCMLNNANIIITHQSTDWLHEKSRAYWNTEVSPPGRFNLHLYGHMHESEASSISTYGSKPRTSMQGSSLFGLEYIKDGTHKRLHGYSAAKFSDQNGRQRLQIWPRSLRLVRSGSHVLGPDFNYELSEDNSFIAFDQGQEIEAKVISKDARYFENSPSELFTEPAKDLADIAVIRYYIHSDPAHRLVRNLERERVCQFLSARRACWVIAEWGMASDEFVSTTLNQYFNNEPNIFRLEAVDFKDKEEFTDKVRVSHGLSLQKMCESIANIPNSCLLLDDISTQIDVESGKLSIEEGIEALCAIIGQFCPEAVIILRSRVPPFRNNFGVVQLREFDEADLRSYVIGRGEDYSEVSSPASIELLHRHTDGVPLSVNTALNDLKIVPLSDLVNSNSDLAWSSHSVADPSTAQPLVKTLDQLENSIIPTSVRAYELLKTLALFPKGEQFTRIKRFNGSHGFFTDNATELLRQVLIHITTLQPVEFQNSSESTKLLVVPRLVRERVRERINTADYQSMNRRAAELYFGSGWENGIFRPPSAYKFDNPHCGSADISNANTIIVRLLKDAIEFGGEREISSALGLALSYSNSLIRGDHYGNVVSLLEDLKYLMPEAGYETKRGQLLLNLAAGLRMLGQHVRAKDIILSVDMSDLSNNNRQKSLIDLLLCHDKLNSNAELMRVGSEIIKIDRNTPWAWQAKSIMLKRQPRSEERTRKLRTLELFCRKNGSNAVANEIALTRAAELQKSSDEIISSLAPVMASTSDKQDFYIRLRAMIKLGDITLAERNELGSQELTGLIKAYHYLFNEKIVGLFDSCHDLLWRHFEQKRDFENLLRLFRHSSLYWRLRGREDKEQDYLNRARDLIRNLSFVNPTQSSREFAYYEVRISMVYLIE